MQIAIIGGGVSALLSAFYLTRKGHQVTIYERSIVGGNCYTAYTPLDQTVRFADLGVNDFNVPQYQEIVDLMNSLEVQYRPLEDTASFFHTDGSCAYTIDGGYATPMPADLQQGYAQFQADAPSVINDPKYANYTVQQYLAEAFPNLPALATQCIYPRVNAMYFCSDDGAAGMPIQAVLHYYVLQEGFGTKVPPQRMYFVGGSNQWIVKLAQACGAQFVTGDATVSLVGQQLRVTANGTTTPYDRVVMAGHADDMLKAYNIPDGEITGFLSQFSYTISTGYAHLYEGVLPSDPRARRTYNVLIRPPGPAPYSMSYVINHHQADMWNPQNNYWNGTTYYVTLNPFVEIPSQYVLLDQSGMPIVRQFKHNVLDFTALNAQQSLWNPPQKQIQGRYGVYFTGGWTVGAGLHIECFHSAVQVTNLIEGGSPAHAAHLVRDPRRAPHEFAPRYLRDV